LLIPLGLAGCAALSLSEPESSTRKFGSRPVAFGLSQATEHEIALLVPAGHRHVPYDWDQVPYPGSYIQVLRACDYYERVLHIAPLTRHRWWCWDRRQRSLIHFSAADRFEAAVTRHPDWVWIVSNEPDLEDQDALSPIEYAEFFGHLAAIIASHAQAKNPAALARLVFCQVSSPQRREYCERAYFALTTLVARGHWPEWPERVSVADVIHAIAVHNYVATYNSCNPDGWRCYGSPLEEEHLADSAAHWVRNMDDFARWADELDGGVLADKPLWLTEFGALWAFCPRRLDLRPRIDQVGGVGCPRAATRHNGERTDDLVFYGRNEREGIWGVQRATLRYLLNPTRDPSGNRGDWVAAWWFNTRINWPHGNECVMTAWLFGHSVDCEQQLDTINRAGETYRSTLECLIASRRCPEPLTDH
jgi:hypothetical protein